jgi:demethylmenaquinone methyltransferase/2-methoxy-6-polyprenyl-1,4-benzoquinol methylase
MTERFYTPGKPRGDQVNKLFTSIAGRYDLVNDLQSFGLHRYWKRRIVRLARVTPGDTALDVCCGTGDLAFALVRAGASVVGLDFNEAMLRIAQTRKKTSEQNQRNRLDALSAVRFVQGDAQQLPFPDCSFNIVTIGYGLRNLTSWEIGFREMARVARPGGRLLVLDFGKPDNAVIRGIYFGYLKIFVPLLGRIFCGNASAYSYILDSLKVYPAQNGVFEEMRKLDLEDVRIINILGGMMSINYGVKRR